MDTTKCVQSNEKSHRYFVIYRGVNNNNGETFGSDGFTFQQENVY